MPSYILAKSKINNKFEVFNYDFEMKSYNNILTKLINDDDFIYQFNNNLMINLIKNAFTKGNYAITELDFGYELDEYDDDLMGIAIHKFNYKCDNSLNNLLELITEINMPIHKIKLRNNNDKENRISIRIIKNNGTAIIITDKHTNNLTEIVNELLCE